LGKCVTYSSKEVRFGSKVRPRGNGRQAESLKDNKAVRKRGGLGFSKAQGREVKGAKTE
jgi:hypothetical protein